jgi:hypothetical protein
MMHARIMESHDAHHAVKKIYAIHAKNGVRPKKKGTMRFPFEKSINQLIRD